VVNKELHRTWLIKQRDLFQKNDPSHLSVRNENERTNVILHILRSSLLRLWGVWKWRLKFRFIKIYFFYILDCFNVLILKIFF
jgi:hypothetical protein